MMLIPRDPFAAGGLTLTVAEDRSGTKADVVFTPPRTRTSYVMVLSDFSVT